MGFTLNYIYIYMHFLKALPLSWHFHNNRSHTLAPAPALRIGDLGFVYSLGQGRKSQSSDTKGSWL